MNDRHQNQVEILQNTYRAHAKHARYFLLACMFSRKIMEEVSFLISKITRLSVRSDDLVSNSVHYVTLNNLYHL